MKEDELKKALSGLLKDAKEKKAIEDETRKAKNEEDRRNIFESVGKDIGQVVGPYIDALGEHSKMNTQAMGDTLKRIITESIKIDAPSVDTQGIQDVLTGAFANLKIPEPIVNYTPPAINVPAIEMPEEMKVSGSVDINGVSKKNPFPVMMMGPDGKPMTFSQAVGMSGGGNFPMQVLDAANNALRVSGSFSITASNASTQAIDSSGNVYSQANPFPVTLVAGAGTSTKAQIGNSDGDFSAANPLPVAFSAASSQAITVANVESVLNSSAVALGSGSTFTGLAEDVKNYASITVVAFADQTSGTNGLSIQQSIDGTNWDVTDTYTIAASTGKVYSVQPVARYFRVVYTNGGTIQGVFRLGSYLHSVAAQPSSQRSADAYTNETDLQQMWSFLSAFNGTTWDRLHTAAGDSAGALRTVHATDATDSVNVVSFNGNTPAVGLNETNTGVLRTVMMTDSVMSVNIVSGVTVGAIGQGDSSSATRVVQAGDSSSSVAASQVGTWNIGTVTSISSTLGANLIDSSGVAYTTSNPFPIFDAGGSVTVDGTVAVSGVSGTVGSALVDSSGVAYSGSNPLPTTASISLPAGPGDGASATRFIQAGDTVSSTNIVTFNGNAPATGLNETTNGVLRVVHMTDTALSVNIVSGSSSGVTGPGEQATALRILQAGDAVSSFNLLQINGSTPATGLNETTSGVLRTIQMTDVVSSTNLATALDQTIDSIAVRQVSGFIDSVSVTGFATSIAASLIDSSGVAYSGSNPLPTTASVSLTLATGQGDGASATRFIQAGDSVSSVYVNNPVDNGDSATALRVTVAGNSAASVSATQVGTWNIGTVTTVTTLSSVTNSVSASIVDSSGVQYSGSNPIPTTIVSGALTSTIAVGDTLARTADAGAAPLKVGGIARTTNPTAYADGDRANFASDKLGRALIRPLQVRDLISTAYVTISSGTETTLIAASAGAFLDCIWMGFANQSTAAVQVDVRCTTAGNIINTVYIPAQSTAGWAPPIPWPQDATGNNWTIDMPDITGTTVTAQALFSKEL